MDKAFENQKRFLVPPTLDEILAFIKELNVTYAHFERYYEIPRGTIKQMRYDGRPLPARYWDIIYLKKKNKGVAPQVAKINMSVDPKSRRKDISGRITTLK